MKLINPLARPRPIDTSFKQANDNCSSSPLSPKIEIKDLFFETVGSSRVYTPTIEMMWTNTAHSLYTGATDSKEDHWVVWLETDNHQVWELDRMTVEIVDRHIGLVDVYNSICRRAYIPLQSLRIIEPLLELCQRR